MYLCGVNRPWPKWATLPSVALMLTGSRVTDILKGVDKTKKYTVTENRREAIIKALNSAKQGDTVLLAGKGHEDYEIDKDGAHPFSEAEIINEFNCGGYVNGDNDGKRSCDTL